jgi:hypothetical protein
MLSTLLNVTGLPIGLRPQEHISSVSPKLVSSGRVLCIAIPNAREDESFADDLNTKRGIVSSRVALLLRSTEIQPAVSKIRALRAPLLSYSIEFSKIISAPPPYSGRSPHKPHTSISQPTHLTHTTSISPPPSFRLRWLSLSCLHSAHLRSLNFRHLAATVHPPVPSDLTQPPVRLSPLPHFTTSHSQTTLLP